MSEESKDCVPSGSCDRCGCELGAGASWKTESWYCCGECADESICICGCRPGQGRYRPSDLYVPARRMFAARHPEYLNTPEGYVQKARAFPFTDRAERPRRKLP